MKCMIATPMRGNSVCTPYVVGLMSCSGLHSGWLPYAGQSDIYVARNVIASQFLASGLDALICIDSDIGFTRQNLIDLIETPAPFVSGIYAEKSGAREPLMRDVNGDVVPTCNLPPEGMLKAKLVAGGFLKIEREVFQAIIDKGLVPAYASGQQHQFYRGRIMDEYLLSEDYSFSLTVGEAGFQPWVNCGIRLDHEGHKL